MPLPPSLPLRPDSGPPFPRPSPSPDPETALARLMSTLDARRQQRETARAEYEAARLASIQRRRPAWWLRDNA
jgi:hypothetical protein